MINVNTLYNPQAGDNPIVQKLLAFIQEGDPWERLVRGYLWAYPIYFHPSVTLKNYQSITKGREKLASIGYDRCLDHPDLLLLIQRGEIELPDELKPFRQPFDEGCFYYATGQCDYWQPDEEKLVRANKAVKEVMVRLLNAQFSLEID